MSRCATVFVVPVQNAVGGLTPTVTCCCIRTDPRTGRHEQDHVFLVPSTTGHLMPVHWRQNDDKDEDEDDEEEEEP